MVEIDFAQLQQWLTAFFWPFVRLSAFLAASPLWGHSSIPMRAKIGLAGLLAVLLGPTLPPLPAVPLVSWASLGIILEQTVIGIAIGLTMRVTFAVVQAAGEIIGLQMGLGFASFFAPDTGTNTMILSRLLYMFSLLIFLALNGHLIVLEILASSFTSLPIGQTLDLAAGETLVRHAAVVFTSGLLLALPLVAALLTINLAMGILNRAAPQLTVFSVGFPVTMLVGLVLLMVLMNDLGRFLEGLFGGALVFLRQLVEGLALAN
jgi:flagellar biosynthetic protein FliR